MTVRLYDSDPYQAEMTAEIVRKELRDGLYRVVLDRTVFCPRGGGQPGDQGKINGIELVDLIEEEGEIIHLIGADPGTGTAKLDLAFDRRYDHMQQHTAQHLLSQYLQREMGINTLSFAIGPDHSSIELSVTALTDDEIDAIEDGCSRLIFRGMPVTIRETGDADSIHLRKPAKKTGTIRVVSIGDYDHSACGGTHVRQTGELGAIKIIRTDKVRGHLRVYYLAGLRALSDHQAKTRILARIQRLVTLPPAEIPDGIESLIRERDELAREVKTLRRRELDAEVTTLAATTDLLIVRRFDDGGIEAMRYFTAALLQTGKNVLAYHPALGYIQVGCGSGATNLKALAPEIFSLLAGKGGGRETLIEGKAADFSRLDEVIGLLQRSFA